MDINDRLFVAETGADRILVYDLWSETLIRRIDCSGGRPTDLAAHGTDIYAVFSAAHQIVRLTARSGPDPVALPAGCTEPSRVAISPAGQMAVLDRQGLPDAHVFFASPSAPPIPVPHATDIEWQSDRVIVVARRPGADFLRYEVAPGEIVVLPTLRARGYDGLGIVATPARLNGSTTATRGRRIGYWTASGFRDAVAARPVFDRVGRVTTYRLDSGDYQTEWGRLFVDACIPAGADLCVHFAAADEPDQDAPILRLPPANVQQITIKPDLTADAADHDGPDE